MGAVMAQRFGADLIITDEDGTEITLLYAGAYLWISGKTGTPPEPPDEGYKFPFRRSLHTTYAGHSGADWPGSAVGSTADIHAIGAGTVQAVYDYTGNTYPFDSSEPVWRGCCVVINHGTVDGHVIWSLYAHMRDVPTVEVGDPITAGQVIGRVGNTGYSNGAHLHFEVIYDGVRLPQDSSPTGYSRTIGWMDTHAVGSWA